MELGQSLRLREEPPDAALAVDTPDVASSGVRSEIRRIFGSAFTNAYAMSSPVIPLDGWRQKQGTPDSMTARCSPGR